MASPSHKYRLSGDSLDGEQIRQLDEMLEDLYTYLTQSPLGTTEDSFDLDVLGILSVDRGGTGTETQFTSGSVIFAGTNGVYTTDNPGIVYDPVTNIFTVFNRTVSNTFVIDPASTGYLWFSGRSLIKSAADGDLTLLNTAETSFGRVNFGGTTASFPALKRNAVALDVKLADDSAYADLTGANVTGRTALSTLSTGKVDFTSRSIIRSSADGQITMFNAAENGFDRINFGGVASTDPALRKESNVLAAKQADGADYTYFKAYEFYISSGGFLMRSNVAWANGAGVGAGTLTNAPAAGNPTKWIKIDDNGTTRYIPTW